jgi:pimeloyl-ACP methyl ester carboxylesterase
LVGNSYGTRAALAILRDWAPMVRSAVLDAAVPPEVGLYEEAPAAAARALDRVFSACTRSSDCAALFPDPAADFSAALAAIESHPLDVDVEHAGQITHVAVDRKLFVSLMVQCLTRDVLAVAVPALVHGATEGDVSGLRELLQPMLASRQSNAFLSSLGMHLSVQCNEEFPFNTEVRAKAVAAENPRTAVLSTYAVQKARCSAWIPPTIDSRDNQRVSSDKPVLFLNGEFDPLTSPEWVNGARQNLPTSAHLIRAGGGHGTLHDVCGFDLVAAYENDPSHAPELDCDTKHPRPPFAVDAATAIRAVGL